MTLWLCGICGSCHPIFCKTWTADETSSFAAPLDYEISVKCVARTPKQYLSMLHFFLLDEPSGQHKNRNLVWRKFLQAKRNKIIGSQRHQVLILDHQRIVGSMNKNSCSLELAICLKSQCPRATSLQSTTQEVHYRKYQGRQDCFVQDSRPYTMGSAAKWKRRKHQFNYSDADRLSWRLGLSDRRSKKN
jgi:hypothetical protein